MLKIVLIGSCMSRL